MEFPDFVGREFQRANCLILLFNFCEVIRDIWHEYSNHSNVMDQTTAAVEKCQEIKKKRLAMGFL